MLASHLQPLRGDEDPTGIALMAEHIYGGKNVLFWVTQLATFAILILAANTAYQGFPGLSSIIARDGYLPRQLANRGDKLVFSNGIIFLAVAAGVLIAVFQGNISALIPLYAFGVFTGFTLSQAGMVVHHLRERGAAVEGVAGDQRRRLRRHGHRRARRRRLQVHRGGVDPGGRSSPRWSSASAPSPSTTRSVREAVGHRRETYAPLRRTHLVVVLVGTVNRGVLEAVQYAKSLAPERLIAVSVVTDAEEQDRARRRVGRPRHARSPCTRSPRRTAS